MTGDWWKWKIDPLSVDCVLVYAQPGHGRRASLYTDYTFAVWSGPAHDSTRSLVPFAKAYSGLTDEEIREVDATVRRTTVERFGPVRVVAPTMVLELAFEGIQRSKRHRSGIAVRFPRILRRRPDKPVQEADTLHTLEALLMKPVKPGSRFSASAVKTRAEHEKHETEARNRGLTPVSRFHASGSFAGRNSRISGSAAIVTHIISRKSCR